MSVEYKPLQITTLEVAGLNHALKAMRNPHMSHDKANIEADMNLAARLIKAGDEHAKAIRGCIVWFELDFQIGWMVEWDTYRIGVEVLSTSSTMHTDLRGMTGHELATLKQKTLPHVVYHQTALASYQALRRIWKQRRNHRHPDWGIFCRWIEQLPYFDPLICPEEHA